MPNQRVTRIVELRTNARPTTLRPYTRALRDVEAAQNRVNVAAARGAVRTRALGSSVQTATRAQRQFNAQVQNGAFQVGDFFVQVASGQSPLRAFTQQATQFLGIFGPVGAIVGAGVAILGALAVAFTGTRGESEKAQTALEKFSGAANDLEGRIGNLQSAATAYANAIKKTGENQTAASNAIIAATAAEFEARKQLLALETEIQRTRATEIGGAIARNERSIQASRDLFGSDQGLERARALAIAQGATPDQVALLEATARRVNGQRLQERLGSEEGVATLTRAGEARTENRSLRIELGLLREAITKSEVLLGSSFREIAATGGAARSSGGGSPGRGRSGPSALDTRADEFRRLEESVFPVIAAERELLKVEQTLAQAVDDGTTSQERAVEIAARKVELMQEQLDPVGAILDGLSREIELQRLINDERQVDIDLRRTQQDLERQGIQLSAEEQSSLRTRLEELDRTRKEGTKTSKTLDVLGGAFGDLGRAAEDGLGRQSSAARAAFGLQRSAALAQVVIDTAAGVQESVARNDFAGAAIKAAGGAAATASILAATLTGFQRGGGFLDGFTGAGSSDRPAGFVHQNEMVMNAGATARNRTALEDMNAGRMVGGGAATTIILVDERQGPEAYLKSPDGVRRVLRIQRENA